MYEKQIQAIQATNPGIILCSGGVNSKYLPTEMTSSDIIEVSKLFLPALNINDSLIAFVHPNLLEVIKNMYKFYTDWPIKSELMPDQIGVFFDLTRTPFKIHFVGSYNVPIKEKYHKEGKDIYVSYFVRKDNLDKTVELWSTAYN